MANEVAITEEFQSALGQWENYDTAPIDHRTQLQAQKHVNLRSMIGDGSTFQDIGRFINMLIMDSMSMNSLDDRRIGVLSHDASARAAIRLGERWTVGTSEKDPARNNWPVLSVTCAAASNPTTTQSVILR